MLIENALFPFEDLFEFGVPEDSVDLSVRHSSCTPDTLDVGTQSRSVGFGRRHRTKEVSNRELSSQWRTFRSQKVVRLFYFISQTVTPPSVSGGRPPRLLHRAHNSPFRPRFVDRGHRGNNPRTL